jgi:hypothetical protein
MATYKVIQDIEAEDKLIGPLSLKQFIFACAAAGSAFIAFLVASKTNLFAFIPFLPFIIIPGVLALPLGKDQPADVWLVAKIRFLLKPHKRIWDQSGIKNLVTITAPKKVEQRLTKDLNQQQVKSRLKALSEIIDSHGWAVKNEMLNLSAVPQYAMAETDRLVDPSELPQNVPIIEVSAADDIMDATSNATAQRFDKLAKTAAVNGRQTAIERMQAAARLAPAPQPDNMRFEAQVVTPGQDESINIGRTSSAEETLLLKQIEHNQQQAQKVSKLISPHHKAVPAPNYTVTRPKNPDIVNLATTDFRVATIASLANRKTSNEAPVDLH